MEKRKESSRLTRECITTALMILLQEKTIDEITITDITVKAGVSRMAYYRNFKNKEDILVSRINEVIEGFGLALANKNITLQKFVFLAGSYFQDNIQFVLALTKAGLANLLLDQISNKVYDLFPFVKDDYANDYRSHFYIGAVLNVLKHWLEKGMVETVEQISEVIFANINEEVIDSFDNLR